MTDTARLDAAGGMARWDGQGARRPLFPGIVDPRTHDEHRSFSRDGARALARLTSLLRSSRVLSTQEALDFACGFMDEALVLTRVVVLHDQAPQPLVWGAASADEASLSRARAAAEATYTRLMSAAGEPWSEAPPSEAPPAEPAPRVVTLPLSIPLLGVIRVESAEPLQQVDLAFLRHAVILLSLALDRCADNISGAPARRPRQPAPPGVGAPSDAREIQLAREIELARELAARLEQRACADVEAHEALRLGRTMTLNVIDLLETIAGRPR